MQKCLLKNKLPLMHPGALLVYDWPCSMSPGVATWEVVNPVMCSYYIWVFDGTIWL